jgi:hypothetical protein
VTAAGSRSRRAADRCRGAPAKARVSQRLTWTTVAGGKPLKWVELAAE